MEPTKGLFDKESDDLERIIDKLSRENKKLAEEVVDLKDLKVMVIDDSKTIRRTAENLLKKEGIKVKDDKVVDFEKLFWNPADEPDF